jgi:hypothetical protein
MGLMCSPHITYLIEIDATYKALANNCICQSLDTRKVKVSESENISYITIICLKKIASSSKCIELQNQWATRLQIFTYDTCLSFLPVIS